MMAPSGVYRIPRSDSPRPRSEVERFAALEYGSSSAAWVSFQARATPPPVPRARPGSGRLAWIRTWFARTDARDASVRPSLAAVHFAGETAHHERATAHPHHSAAPVADLPPALAILRVLDDPRDDELRECHP